MDRNSLGFPVLRCLSEFAQTHIHWVTDAIQPSHPLSPPSPFAFSLFQHQGLFQWVSGLFASGGQSIGVSASAEVVLPMNIQYWFPLGLTSWSPCSQGTLKSLLQHHSSKASILCLSPFFMIQSSHLYVTTGKTIILTTRIFVGKVTSLPDLVELETVMQWDGETLCPFLCASFFTRAPPVTHPRRLDPHSALAHPSPQLYGK